MSRNLNEIVRSWIRLLYCKLWCDYFKPWTEWIKVKSIFLSKSYPIFIYICMIQIAKELACRNCWICFRWTHSFSSCCVSCFLTAATRMSTASRMSHHLANLTTGLPVRAPALVRRRAVILIFGKAGCSWNIKWQKGIVAFSGNGGRKNIFQLQAAWQIISDMD